MSEWTEGKISKLKDLWSRGFSTSEIGKKLDMTKNSIIGKINRLGLSSADKGVAGKGVAGKAAGKSAGKVAKAAPKAVAKSAPKANAKKPAAPVKKAAAKVVPVKTAPKKSAAVLKAAVKTPAKSALKKVEKIAPAPVKTAPKKPADSKKTDKKSGELDLFEIAGKKTSAVKQSLKSETTPSKSAAAMPLFDEKPVQFERLAADAPRYQLFDLTADMCCWPLEGEAGDEESYFCGKKTYKGKPYCLEHSKLAYTNITPEKDGDLDHSGRADEQEFEDE